MKDFQEFCDSLDESFCYEDIIPEVEEALRAKAPAINTIMATSFAVAMRVLERYHYWLHENDEPENAE